MSPTTEIVIVWVRGHSRASGKLLPSRAWMSLIGPEDWSDTIEHVLEELLESLGLSKLEGQLT